MVRLSVPLAAMCTLLLLAGCSDPKQKRLDAWIEAEQAAGNMRTDIAPADAPFDASTLALNFERVAFEHEDQFNEAEKKNIPKPPAMLRKWQTEIRYQTFGRNVGASLSRSHVKRFMARMSGISGIEVTHWNKLTEQERAKQPANFLITMGNAVEFNHLARRLPQRVANLKEGKGRGTRVLADFMEIWHPSGSPCALKVFTRNVDDESTGEIILALILMRTDVTEILRDACVEEELSQAFGLLNDHPDLRPSIFNDDQEFALLTRHDELLLRILYDDRLDVGMTPEVAMPIVRQIAAELMTDG